MKECRKSPCFGCYERKYACHAECEKHIRYREKIGMANKKKRMSNEVTGVIIESIRKAAGEKHSGKR